MPGLPPPDKLTLHARCVSLVQARIAEMQHQLSGLAESVANETKSTAGDKYETARAMLHIEQDQVRARLQEAQAQLGTLRGIDPTAAALQVGTGSLVQLDSGWFFLSTGLGKLLIDGVAIFAISAQSPLGRLLLGKTVDDIVEFNDREFRIKALL